MEGIIRKATERDNDYFDIDLGQPRQKHTAGEKFTIELHKQEQIATKKGLPFARHVAVADREDYQRKVEQTLKREGMLPDNFPRFEVDWTKYSDLKNFELAETTQRADPDLSKHNPGMHVMSEVKNYKFKGYGANTYKVMDDGPTSIRKAAEKRKADLK